MFIWPYLSLGFAFAFLIFAWTSLDFSADACLLLFTWSCLFHQSVFSYFTRSEDCYCRCYCSPFGFFFLCVRSKDVEISTINAGHDLFLEKSKPRAWPNSGSVFIIKATCWSADEYIESVVY